MTYIDAAATRCAGMRCAVVVILGIAGIGLAGCGANTDSLGSGGLTASKTPTPAAPVLTPVKPPSRATIAIAPIIGAPDSVSKQMTAKLTRAIEAQSVAISTVKGAAVDYTLRGYVVASRESSSTKISYIWDVTDPRGKRVNRITGEQIINGVSGKDPWVAVSPAIMQAITDKTASSFGRWLPKKAVKQAVASSSRGLAAKAVKTAATGAALASTAAGAKRLKPQLASLKPSANSALSSTGRRGRIVAIVPSVTGAPGDGKVSLASALQRELSRNGISLTNKRSSSSYSVIGKVVVGKASKGQQPIKIDWQVKDPKGKALGTVSQKNKIPQGSLDGPWGKTADAAAAAAAQGILKLLPKPNATN